MATFLPCQRTAPGRGASAPVNHEPGLTTGGGRHQRARGAFMVATLTPGANCTTFCARRSGDLHTSPPPSEQSGQLANPRAD